MTETARSSDGFIQLPQELWQFFARLIGPIHIGHDISLTALSCGGLESSVARLPKYADEMNVDRADLELIALWVQESSIGAPRCLDSLRRQLF